MSIIVDKLNLSQVIAWDDIMMNMGNMGCSFSKISIHCPTMINGMPISKFPPYPPFFRVAPSPSEQTYTG